MGVARGDRALEEVLPGGAFPLIVRPVGSHAGKGLERIDDAAALAAHVEQARVQAAYVSRFVDYASADGRWRKYRVAFMAGRPYLAHMAVGDHWMVHYLNAGMADSAGKRAEEAAAMAGFDEAFAVRHAAAFAALHERLGLDYFAIDCAELPDGRLLLFEADVSMIVHALDPEDLYPYKRPQMAKLFGAFEGLLKARAGS
jgi:glutathione synthase/RimK-type ligase-like ATP-grasp enzyme